VVAPPSVAETKLNAGASFPNFKVLMAKWRSQTLLFESVTDKQKNKQTNKQKTLNFFAT